jgi:hypothetical protein
MAKQIGKINIHQEDYEAQCEPRSYEKRREGVCVESEGKDVGRLLAKVEGRKT